MWYCGDWSLVVFCSCVEMRLAAWDTNSLYEVNTFDFSSAAPWSKKRHMQTITTNNMGKCRPRGRVLHQCLCTSIRSLHYKSGWYSKQSEQSQRKQGIFGNGFKSNILYKLKLSQSATIPTTGSLFRYTFVFPATCICKRPKFISGMQICSLVYAWLNILFSSLATHLNTWRCFSKDKNTV